MRVEVVPASIERWPDITRLFSGHGERGCWCQYRRQSSSTYSRGGPGSGEANLRRQVEEGPPPALLAYVDEEPAGWLGFWPMERMERLARSRTIPKIDEKPVWSIVCFLVWVGYRRKGVAEVLLDGAINFARKAGTPALEAYPIDPEGSRVEVNFGYAGFITMFERAGFERVLETAARSDRRPRWLMRLNLT